MKKTLLLILFLLPFFGIAQLSGNIVIGPSNSDSNFKTLAAAVARLNAVGINGNLFFLLDEDQLLTSPLTIGPFSSTGSYNVTIKPNTNRNILIHGTAPGLALITLNNADNVIIDGNNSTDNNRLKIYNTYDNNNSNYVNRAAIYISNGSDNNKIQNLTVELNTLGSNIGTVSTGILAGGSNFNSSGNNLNNTIQNVTFTKVKQAIVIKGQNTSNSGWKILSNQISSTDDNTKAFVGISIFNASDYTITGNTLNGIRIPPNFDGNFSHSCIYLENANNGTITKNTIANVENNIGNGSQFGIYVKGDYATISENTITKLYSFSNSTGTFGIRLEGNNGIISNNKINSVVSGSSQGKLTSGIYIDGNNQSIYNNFVLDANSSGGGQASSQDGFGIYINNGSNIRLYHNSVKLNVNQSSGSSAALYVRDGSNFDIRNNIFVNTQTSGSVRFAVYFETSDSSKFTNLDYNDYYSSQYLGCFGNYYNGGNRKTTLTEWIGATTKESHSKNDNPTFISSLYLDPNNATNKTLTGTLLSEVTTDIDKNPRVKPYMGAHELTTCVPQGNEIEYGRDKWIGYVYNSTTLPPSTDPNPATPTTLQIANMTYIGQVEENKLFNRDNVKGAVSGLNPQLCETPSDYFFVRYKMKTKVDVTGIYNITVGGDDYYRLYLTTSSGTEKIINQWSGLNYSQKAKNIELTAGVEYTFDLEYYEKTTDSRIQFSMGLIAGKNTAPYPFGDNLWKVYGFTTAASGTNFSIPQDSYAGYYSVNPVNINTTNSFALRESPSFDPNLSGWQGAPVPQDYFTLVYKRQGFPCGTYQIQITNCDDRVQIFIDDENATQPVYTSSGNINANTPENEILTSPRILGKNSKIEIRLKEYDRDARLNLNFIKVETDYNGTGTPAANSSIVIKSNTTLTSDLTVCSCTVNDNVTLTVPENITLTVDEDINVLGTGKLLITNGGSLLQTSTSKTMFSGSIDAFEIQRETYVRRYDGTYWSMPVTHPGFKMVNFSPNTLADKYLIYNPSKGWEVNYGGTEEMKTGKGYGIRAPQSHPIDTQQLFTGVFTGTPNNGDIPVTVEKGLWNLVGNPYPSAIDADTFLRDNPGVGAIYLWAHQNLPVQNGSGDGKYYYTDDFTIFNSLGAAGNPYRPFLGYIAATQGFLIKAPANTTTINFNNLQRQAGKNSQFYKTAESSIERNRVWINLTNTTGTFKQILLGYATGATNVIDVDFDALSMASTNAVDFYSINSSKKMVIQGRALPFLKTDTVPLGIILTAKGEYTIAIDHADGFFNEGQDIFLQDKTTGKTTNLRLANYTFTSEAGSFNSRFVLRYTDNTLGTDDFENSTDGLFVAVKNKTINITSSNELISEVTVYNLLGQEIFSKKKISSNALEISNLQTGNQVLLVKTTLENGSVSTKKIIMN